ncbi:MAG: TVP38/TMEM64 family protein [Pseudomonadota bacterium]|nr:TVP38/TMEM64 family protein [Pseudomonadota bacterium]
MIEICVMADPLSISPQPPNKGSSFARLLPLAAVLAVIVAVFIFGLDKYLTFDMLSDHRQDLIQWTQKNRFLSVVGFVAIYVLVVALSLPGATLLTLAGGFLFGTVESTIYVVVSATLGALGIFLITRYALADFFHAKTGDTGHKMEQGFRENALSYLLVLRLVPLFPFWLVNLVPALLSVPARTFVIGTFLGIIPGVAVYSSVGSGLGVVFDSGDSPDLGIIFEPEILGPLIGLAVLSLIPIVYKRYKTAKS